MIILKLESSASSPVDTSLEVSMPHQPTTFSFPKRQFSNSKLVVHLLQAGRVHGVASNHIIIKSQIVMVPFALYACAMEKMPSGNTDTAFVSNCDNDYN